MKQKKGQERSNQFDLLAQKKHYRQSTLPTEEKEEEEEYHVENPSPRKRYYKTNSILEDEVDPETCIIKFEHTEGITLQELLSKKICSRFIGRTLNNPELNNLKPSSFECGALTIIYPIIYNKEP